MTTQQLFSETTATALRTLHTRFLFLEADDAGPEVWACDHCLDNDGFPWPWPCPTIEILDGTPLEEILKRFEIPHDPS